MVVGLLAQLPQLQSHSVLIAIVLGSLQMGKRLPVYLRAKALICVHGFVWMSPTPELAAVMAQLWTGRSDRFSEERGLMQKGNRHAEMAYLGG